jgi:anthranilate synthase
MSAEGPSTPRVTPCGLQLYRQSRAVDASTRLEQLIGALDERRGVLLASTYEYPGRYTRWDLGFVDPPIAITARGRSFSVEQLTVRGAALLSACERLLTAHPDIDDLVHDGDRLIGQVRGSDRVRREEERSRQPSPFSVLRALLTGLRVEGDSNWGLYGALGYDLGLHFHGVSLLKERPADHRDLVLYIPDRLLVVDHSRASAVEYEYDFVYGDDDSRGQYPRAVESGWTASDEPGHQGRELAPGRYAEIVHRARESFRRGDLFEVVPSQSFTRANATAPSELFRRLRQQNPAPYGALMNLGAREFLVAASPEMYVRVTGRRVETCPISGTIARGKDVYGDADAVLELLKSEKDRAELTMCTDVDRNDKSRVCEPGSVRVLGRRQIEMYSRVIHTVDHVEGTLREGYDALDAFLSHTWAVTVTGAPKVAAMRFIEEQENQPRGWYGGAIGQIAFDGSMNTGLTLRTVHLKGMQARIRAGATLLIDSDPEAEERETELKASAFLAALDAASEPRDRPIPTLTERDTSTRVLLIDHEDSFVHTLANYLRFCGAEVVTVSARYGTEMVRTALRDEAPDLVVLSPGPGRPTNFSMDQNIGAALDHGCAVFGVCLGLQGIVEAFGGSLGQLEWPMHGRPSPIRILGGSLLTGLQDGFEAGRYHSLFAREDDLPAELEVTARTDDGVIMAIEHRSLPVAAVQFHPESIMTLKGDAGLTVVRNALGLARRGNDQDE